MPLRTEKPRLGSEIVELSGEAKYPSDSIYYALREYVANSIDAINAFERFNEDEGLQLPMDRTIEIILEGDTLHIFDKGIGIDEERLLKFTDLCSSEKNPQYDVGRFGFGSHAGGAIANKAILFGKTHNSTDVFIGSIDFDMIRKNRLRKGGPNFIEDAEQLLSKVITEDIAKYKRPKDTHFAHLALKLRDDFREKWNEDDARFFLGQYCPVDFDPEWKNNNGKLWGDIVKNELPDDTIQSVEIFLNGKPVYKPYTHKQLKKIEIKELYAGDNSGKLLARCWYAQTTGDNMIGQTPGRSKLSLYLHGMMIDTIRRDYLESQSSVKKSENLRHYVGEIHVVNSKGIIPHDVRTSVTGGEDWEDLKEQISQLLVNLERRRSKTSRVNNARKRLDKASEEVKNINSQSISQLPLEKLNELKNTCDELLGKFEKDFSLDKKTKSGTERAKRTQFNDFPPQKNKYERMLKKLKKDIQEIELRKQDLESQEQSVEHPSQLQTTLEGKKQTYQVSNSRPDTSILPPVQPTINDLHPSPIKGQPQSNVEQKREPDSNKTTQSTSELNFNIPAQDVVVLVEKIMVEVGVPEVAVQQAIARLKQELPSRTTINA